MEDDRQRRLAVNEALARDVNEVVEQVSASWHDRDDLIDFRCECAMPSCRMPVRITRMEYEAVRESPTRFVVVEGHVLAEVEEVVGHVREYPLVEKRGAGVAIAEATDPRA